VTADNVARALAAHGRELHFPVLHLHQAQLGHARKHSRGGLFACGQQIPRWTCGVQLLRLSGLPLLAAHPNLFEEMVEADFVVGGNGCATIRRVGKRAIQRMAWPVLRRIEVQVTVSQLDAAVSLARNVRVVGHH